MGHDMTPDELRKWAENESDGVLLIPASRLFAAADAWKADLEWHREQTEGVWAANAVLRQRLEAVRALAGENFDSLTIERKLNAALAGKP